MMFGRLEYGGINLRFSSLQGPLERTRASVSGQHQIAKKIAKKANKKGDRGVPYSGP